MNLGKLACMLVLVVAFAFGSDNVASAADTSKSHAVTNVTALDARSVKLSDGTYTRDDKERIIETVSADGKWKRTFKYGDSADSNRATEITVNGETYKYLGPITSDGKPLTVEGRVAASWSVYDDKGNLLRHWYGVREITKNGVYILYNYDKSEGVKQGADGNKLSDQEVTVRESGIWPSQLVAVHENGRKYTAKLQGVKVLSLKEEWSENGTTVVRQWTPNGSEWRSSDTPAQIRFNLGLTRSGGLQYELSDGSKILENPNGSRKVTKNGVTVSRDKDGNLIQVTNEKSGFNRSFAGTIQSGGKMLVERISTELGGTTVTATRVPGSDKWRFAGQEESWKNLKLSDDGLISFERANGNQVRESNALALVEYDSKDRPVSLTFASGSQRQLTYSSKGEPESFTDTVPLKDGKTAVTVWRRAAAAGSFTSKDTSGKERSRSKVVFTDLGDVRYEGSDGKEHVSKAADLDRQARGEYVLSSESVTEARDRLLEAAQSLGAKSDRVTRFVKLMEESSTKYGVKQEQLVKAMDNLSALLGAKGKNDIYGDKELIAIFETALHNLARPMEIDQGYHPTCNVTGIEVYAAARHPDEYTRLVKEIVLTGKWKASTGETVTPPTKALQFGDDEKSYDVDKPDSGKRNAASQVVQMTLINGMYETGRMNRNGANNSSYRYVLGKKRSQTDYMNGQMVTIILGEDMLVQKDGSPVMATNPRTGRSEPQDGPGMIQDDVLKSGKMLFGYEPPFIKTATKISDGTRTWWENDLPDKNRLLKWKQDGKLPLITPTMGGAHTQTIHDVWVNPNSGTVWVLLDNQHGEPEAKGSSARSSGEGDADGWITLDDLHKTLKSPEQGSGFGQPVMPKVKRYDHPSKQR